MKLTQTFSSSAKIRVYPCHPWFSFRVFGVFRGFCCLILLPSSLCLNATPVVFQSSENQTSLLELYTSEGCSSCPPAEAWLSRLKESPGLWKDFVPVAFHVDYWDHLGWRDPWATKAFSERQRLYAQSWRSDSVYTPGFVLAGKEWRAWSRSKDGPPASGTKAGVLRVSSEDQSHWQVSFNPGPHRQGSYEVRAALMAGNLFSDVKAGENRGRRLNHDFVVTALVTNSLTTDREILIGHFVLDFKQPKSSLQPPTSFVSARFFSSRSNECTAFPRTSTASASIFRKSKRPFRSRT